MSDGSAQEDPQVISGRYVFVPNPCITKPCLPGMAFAVESGGELLFIAIGGQWSSEPRSWGDYRPQAGDRVIVSGQVHTCVDTNGQPFRVIEVKSVAPG